ncbi:MAG: Ig-like domain-containing protein, partial [Turicibacter sp.]
HYDGIEVILDNDLDFGGRNWTPIAYDSDYYFGGNFNGNGKTINNFLISNLEYRLVGLFGRMKNSVIHDLTFESPIIRGSTTKANNIAIVTGVGEAVEFRNISINNPLLDIDDSVAVNNQTAVLIAGCGMNEGSTIINVDVNNMIINYRTHSSGVKQISGLASNVPDALRLIVNSSVTGKINVVNAGGSATAMISGLIANESFHSTSQNLFNCYTDITIQTNISAYIGSIIGRIATSRSDYILNKNVFAHFDYTYPTYGSYWTVVEHTSPEVFRQENVFFNGNINGAEVESTDRKDEIHADFAQATAPISDPSSVVRQLNEGIKELPELDGITYRTWRLNGLYPELGEPSTVTLNQNSITMKSGETTSLSARVNPISMGTDLYWESENTTIAAVDQSGKITGKTPGTTIIKAMSKDGQIAVCKVKVEAVTTSIILMIEGEDKDTELCVNDYRTITAEMQPIDEQLTWISSNPEVLSIIEDSENNKHIEIYALRHGQATITAES